MNFIIIQTIALKKVTLGMICIILAKNNRRYISSNFWEKNWDFLHLFIFFINPRKTQRAEAILNKISNIIKKIHTGLISVLPEFQKCIA